MKKILITLLAIPCLARGIFAQGTRVVAGDTVRRLSVDSDTAFHPIDLQRAIQLAQRNAPIAVQARGQIRTATSSVKAAYAALLPGVNLSLGQVNQSGDRMDAEGRIVHDSSDFSGLAAWRLLKGGPHLGEITMFRNIPEPFCPICGRADAQLISQREASCGT